MRICRFGVELRSLQKSDLEQVLRWRNQPDVASYMFVTDEISMEEHLNWFNSLTSNDVYLVIQVDQKQIGVINVKQIDWENRSGEAGIFIGEKAYRNSPIAMQAIFALMDTFFDDFNFKMLKATVKRTNVSAIDFNLRLGYEICAEEEDQIRMRVSAENYASAREKFRSILKKIEPSGKSLELSSAENERFFV